MTYSELLATIASALATAGIIWLFWWIIKDDVKPHRWPEEDVKHG